MGRQENRVPSQDQTRPSAAVKSAAKSTGPSLGPRLGSTACRLARKLSSPTRLPQGNDTIHLSSRASVRTQGSTHITRRHWAQRQTRGQQPLSSCHDPCYRPPHFSKVLKPHSPALPHGRLIYDCGSQG